MISPAIYLGDFTAESIRPIGSIAPEVESGEYLRTLWIFADPITGDAANHWVLTVGRYAVGGFKTERSLPFPDGFPGTPVSFTMTPEIRVSRGDVLALQARPTGENASPLTGLSVIPEYAHSGSRVR